jgi:hypothetical protein
MGNVSLQKCSMRGKTPIEQNNAGLNSFNFKHPGGNGQLFEIRNKSEYTLEGKACQRANIKEIRNN